jgi:hypothetical protein
MADLDDDDLAAVVADRIDDPIVSLTDPISLWRRELLAPTRGK